MCGIVSIVSKRQGGFWNADLEMFEGLLVLDTLRGLDSTGAFCIDSSRTVGYIKVASHPYHLFAMQEYPTWRARAISSGRILVGHNRKATQGSINSKNAHPFHSGNVILVHNGTLRCDHKKELAPVEVDSHALAIAIDERGAEAVLSDLNGAFTLIWWDMAKSSLFAITNGERPLEIVETDDSFFLLSESWMALQLLARDKKKVTDVVSVKPGALYEFKIGGQHTVTDIPLRKFEPVVYHTGRGHYQQSGGTSSVAAGKPAGGTPTTGPTTTSTPASQQTALTVVKTASPQAGVEDRGTAANSPCTLPVDMANHVPCFEFTKGQTVLVKFYEMKLGPASQPGQGLYFCRGKVVEPNTPEIDVACYIKETDIPEGDQIKYVNNQSVEAVVVKHTQTTCGRSLYVNKVSLPKLLDVHNARVTESEWQYVTTYCKCSQCKASIFEEEQMYTSIARRPNNQYTVICAECVEDTLKGSDKHEFNQNRLAAVQSHVGKRLAAAIGDDSGTQAASTTTLH